MSKLSRGFVTVGVLAVLALGLTPAKAAAGRTLEHEVLCSTDHEFTRDIDNQYLPMPQVDQGESPIVLGMFTGDGEGLTITVLPGFKMVAGVKANIVEEFEWLENNENGVWEPELGEAVVEISRNYFAQTEEEGTVCYFGEDVDIWDPPTTDPENDPADRHDGAWLAGVNGDQGIMMPAAPRKGDVYMQENAPAALARDQAVVEGFGTIKVGDSKYKKAMRTTECNLAEDPDCLDPSHKVYAPGEGLVADGDLVRL